MSLVLWHPVMLVFGCVCCYFAWLLIQVPPKRLAEILTLRIEGKWYWQPPTFWGKTVEEKIPRMHGIIYQVIATLLLLGVASLILAWIPYATPTGR